MFSRWWRTKFAWFMTTMPVWAAIFTIMDGGQGKLEWKFAVFAVVWVGFGLLAIWRLKLWPFGPLDD